MDQHRLAFGQVCQVQQAVRGGQECDRQRSAFFGGEGGVSTNRMTGHSLFGLGYGARHG